MPHTLLYLITSIPITCQVFDHNTCHRPGAHFFYCIYLFPQPLPPYFITGCSSITFNFPNRKRKYTCTQNPISSLAGIYKGEEKLLSLIICPHQRLSFLKPLIWHFSQAHKCLRLKSTLLSSHWSPGGLNPINSPLRKEFLKIRPFSV